MSTVAIKIECECGQHYAFDVEPVDGQMPSPVACPACGADATAAANQMIARELALPAIRISRPVEADAKGGLSVPRRPIPGARVLVDDNATRDLIEAKLDIKRATSAAVIVAGLDLLLAILSVCGIEILGADLWILLDVAVVAGLAYGIHRFSRTCAILMCLYYLALCIIMGGKTGLAGIIYRGVFLYYFARGAQAMFSYHKLSKRGKAA